MCDHGNKMYDRGYLVCSDCGECFNDLHLSDQTSKKSVQTFPIYNEINVIKFKIEILVNNFNQVLGTGINLFRHDNNFCKPSVLVEDLFEIVYNRLGIRNFDTTDFETLVYGILFFIFKNVNLRYIKRSVTEYFNYEKFRDGYLHVLNSVLPDLNEMRERYHPLVHTLKMDKDTLRMLEKWFFWLNRTKKLHYGLLAWWSSFYRTFFYSYFKKFQKINDGIYPVTELNEVLKMEEEKSKFLREMLNRLNRFNF